MSENDNRRVHRQLTINSASNLARYVISIAITFFLTPFIVRTLGDSLYGFWVLVSSFIGYASILEMGVQPAVVKLVGQYRGADDRGKLHDLITAALTFFLGVSVVAGVLIVFVVPPLVERNVEGLQDLPRQGLLFALIAVDTALMYLNYLFTGILYGWQRYHLRNIIDVVGWILNAVLLLSFLETGGILALVFAKLAMDLVIVAASAMAARRLLPEMSLLPRISSRDSFRELMGFGGRVFLSATMTRVASHTQPVIISGALTAAATTFYAIPSRLVDYARQTGWALTASFMPMFSELQGRQEQDLIRAVYLRYTRYIFMILLPILLFLFVYGTPFIGLWIEPVYAEMGRVPLLLLTATMLVESAQSLIWRFFLGVGQLNFLVKISAVGSAFAIVSCLLLVRPLGISGVALSMLVGAVGTQAVYALKSSRYLKMSLASIFGQVHLRPLLVFAVTFGCAMLFESLLGSDSYLSIGLGFLPTLVVYAALGFAVGLTGGERGVLVRKVSGWMRRPRLETPKG